MKIRKNIQFMHQKISRKKYVDLLLIEEKRKRYYVLIKDFRIFKYNDTLHGRKKYFCLYCLQAFSIEEILKLHIKEL